MRFHVPVVDFVHLKATLLKSRLTAMSLPGRNRVAFLVGLASSIAFAPLSLWPILPIAFAVLIWLIDLSPAPRAAARTGWWFSFGQLVAGLYWIAISWQYQANMPVLLGFVAVLLLSAYLALFGSLACYVAGKFWHGGPARIFLFAACWAMGEWLRGFVFTGFPWNAAGSAWLSVLPVAQAASVVGVFGLTIMMLLCGGALALLESERSLAGRAMRHLGTSLLFVVAIGAVYMLLTPTVFWPRVQLHIVQANIGQDAKWSQEDFRLPLRKHLGMTQEALAQRGPGIFIWPETAIPNLLDEEITSRYLISRAIGEDSILLTGADRAQRSRQGEILAAYNSLMVINAAGEITEIYDKVHLVPFGEYLPVRSLLDPIGLSRLAPGSIDFLAGPKRRTLELGKLPRVGPLICYEAIFPGQVVDRKNRPDWMLNISNDAWFGKSSGPYQHLAHARLRAIEEGLPMVRATPTGISAVIDAHGRLTARAEAHVATVLTTGLPKPLARTVYGRFGDLGFFVLAGALLFLGVRRTSNG
jgi:apolipoprotein N-acyltransferase